MQAFAETPELELLFIMRFSSERFQNLIKRPKVTVLVDTPRRGQAGHLRN